MRKMSWLVTALVLIGGTGSIAATGAVSPETVASFCQQTGTKLPEVEQLEIGQAVQVTVEGSDKLTLKIISMDRNFGCQKGDRIQIKFTGSTSAEMLLSSVGKVAIFTFKDGKWKVEKLDRATIWKP